MRYLNFIIAIALCACIGCGKIVDATNSNDNGAIDAAIDATLSPCEANELPLDDLEECMGAALCGWFGRCLGFSPAECDPMNLGDLDLHTAISRFKSAVASGNTQYSPVDAAICVAAAAASSCDRFPVEGDACESILAGTLAGGSDCYYDEECISRECDKEQAPCGADQCCRGVCKATVGLHASCASGEECERPLRCVTGATGGRSCETGLTDSYCAESYDCQDAFYCEIDKCRADQGPNATCSDDEQCQVGLKCVGDALNPPAGTCVTAVLGEPCDNECTAPSYCLANDPGSLGTCVALPTVDESCADSQYCAGANVFCDSTTNLCKPSPGVNQICAAGSGSPCAAGLVCDEAQNRCVSKKSNGTGCGYDSECQSGICAGAPATCQAYLECYL